MWFIRINNALIVQLDVKMVKDGMGRFLNSVNDRNDEREI